MTILPQDPSTPDSHHDSHHDAQPLPESLTRELTVLHEQYVEAVNRAVAADDLVLVDELARDFDRDALDLMTQHLRGHAA